MIAGIAVGEADGQGFIPRIGHLAFFLAPVHPVDVEAGGVHVQSPHGKGEGLSGRLGNPQEDLRDPGLEEVVQHPTHAVVVEELGGDSRS
ncbi:hypothetical protein Mhypo_01760 [Meiothermus hypogaeus]|uniref:Uncharacterized protein n=1 Tax=Meiothermus hypogaeus TaxID=884155 RepID=A0ABX9MM13_9DEIN|nr:hypothetical protein Mhypo_01760 [Meiothermus hypogaeus]